MEKLLSTGSADRNLLHRCHVAAQGGSNFFDGMIADCRIHFYEALVVHLIVWDVESFANYVHVNSLHEIAQ